MMEKPYNEVLYDVQKKIFGDMWIPSDLLKKYDFIFDNKESKIRVQKNILKKNV